MEYSYNFTAEYDGKYSKKMNTIIPKRMGSYEFNLKIS